MGAMNAEDIAKYKGVFVFAQQVDNKLSSIAFELIGEGKRLAANLDTKEVTAVLIGSNTVQTGSSLLTIPNLKHTEQSLMLRLLQLL